MVKMLDNYKICWTLWQGRGILPVSWLTSYLGWTRLSSPSSESVHFKEQLYLDCATLLIKRAVKGQGAWSDTSNLTELLVSEERVSFY